MAEHAPIVLEFPGTRMIRYTFPLRPDLDVILVLPQDLHVEEVARLECFLLSLVSENVQRGPDCASRGR